MEEEKDEEITLKNIQEIFSYCVDIEDNITVLRIELDKAKNYLRYCLTGTVEQKSDEFIFLLNTIYWTKGYSKIVRETTKARGMKYKPTPKYGVRCDICNQIIPLTTATKLDESQTDEIRGGKRITKIMICNDCHKKESEDAHERYEKQRIEETARREQELNILRTMPYDDYLQTYHWKEIRKGALRRARYKCQLCNNSGELHVHHKTYDTRGKEGYDDVIVLCSDCHAKFHDKVEP